MRKPKGVILFISALFLLIGSIGVNVFLHTCEEDGTFVSYFVPTEDHCDTEHEDLPDCCAEEEKEDGDCCGDEIKHFKVDLDYFQKISTPFIPLQSSIQPVIVEKTELSDEDLTVNNYANPPPKRRNVERSLFQIWII